MRFVKNGSQSVTCIRDLHSRLRLASLCLIDKYLRLLSQGYSV